MPKCYYIIPIVVGVCPGPLLVNMARLGISQLIFLGFMLAGIYTHLLILLSYIVPYVCTVYCMCIGMYTALGQYYLPAIASTTANEAQPLIA